MSEPTTRRGIMVGVDGSDPCRAAVRWHRVTRLRNAPLTLVHVVNVRYTTMPQTPLLRRHRRDPETPVDVPPGWTVSAVKPSSDTIPYPMFVRTGGHCCRTIRKR
jgi:nucleotide-binding universal stress UspA family protein